MRVPYKLFKHRGATDTECPPSRLLAVATLIASSLFSIAVGQTMSPPPLLLDAPSFTVTGSASVTEGGTVVLTRNQRSQTGLAFIQLSDGAVTSTRLGNGDLVNEFHVQFQQYIGDGNGADGYCVNVGTNSLDSGIGGNTGISAGLALCFSSWQYRAHFSLKYNAAVIWSTDGSLSDAVYTLFADSAWHTIDLLVERISNGRYIVSIGFDGYNTILWPETSSSVSLVSDSSRLEIGSFDLPTPTYLTFTGRTGDDTNNHWVRNVRISEPLCSSGQYLPHWGEYWRCLSCGAGQYHPGGYRSPTACIDCPAGQHGLSDDHTRNMCETCPNGRYTGETSSVYCRECPNGKHPDSSRTTCTLANNTLEDNSSEEEDDIMFFISTRTAKSIPSRVHYLDLLNMAA